MVDCKFHHNETFVDVVSQGIVEQYTSYESTKSNLIRDNVLAAINELRTEQFHKIVNYHDLHELA